MNTMNLNRNLTLRSLLLRDRSGFVLFEDYDGV